MSFRAARLRSTGLVAFAAAGLAWTAGCGGSASDSEAFAAAEAGPIASCSGDTAHRVLPGIEGYDPAPAVDYLATRTETGEAVAAAGAHAMAPPGGIAWSATLTSEHGTARSGAKDVAACKAKVAALRFLTTDPAQCHAGMVAGQCSESYAIYTRGDEVATTHTRTDCGAGTRDDIVLRVKSDGTAAVVAKRTTSIGPCPAG